VALDTSGKLYVANFDPRYNSVSVFDTVHGNAALPAITGGGLNQSFGAAVDASGKLYVANHYSDSVSVFDTAHGNAALPVITGNGLNQPSGVAVDTSGKLYVANYNATSISVFDTAHSNAALPAITGGGLNQPSAVALDAKRQALRRKLVRAKREHLRHGARLRGAPGNHRRAEVSRGLDGALTR